jgi:putative ABC transport system permease protein
VEFANKIFLSSLLAVIIAMLGLFGLTSYSTSQRSREIAVRKVLGGSVGRIVALLVSDFVRWVLLANLFAWPVAWWVMREWLDGFAFRINLGLLPFLAAGIAAMLIAVLTVIGLSLRAARINPAEVLSRE